MFISKNLLTLLVAGIFLAPRSSRAEEFQEIIVAPGDTLWSLSNKYLKDPRKWSEIVQYNHLQTSDPTVALPGTKIKLPILLIKEEYRNALLIESIPEVRYKRKNEAEWHEAKAEMTLKYEDSLRTMEGAKALVKFPTTEVVQINENSYVVLKPERILQEIQLLQGDVRASRAKIILPQGTVVQPKGMKSDYQAKIREDKSEVVFVYKGKVDVTAKGQTVTVHEGYGTQILKSAPPMKPAPLSTFNDFNPAEMTAEVPLSTKVDLSNGLVNFDPPKPPSKDMGPHKEGGSKSVVSEKMLSHYRLQLSQEEKFTNIIFDKTEPTGTPFDLKKTPVPDGTYFMRVAFVDALGNMGEFSVPTTLTKDSKAPIIKNVVPEEGQQFRGEESYCDVIGMVEGAAMVAVDNEVVFISPTGRFNKLITLKEGTNRIKITARDTHGNETIVERNVTYSKK